MQLNGFPEFGKELKRPFPVHENCYDCAEFYDGCTGWRAARDFACEEFNRLPDVMPGTYGQVFPVLHRRARMNPVLEEDREIAPDGNRRAGVAGRRPRTRICRCGEILPKGKHLCESCRVRNRRQTKREYMRTYMGRRRSGSVNCGSHVPFPAAGTPPRRGSSGDLLLIDHR